MSFKEDLIYGLAAYGAAMRGDYISMKSFNDLLKQLLKRVTALRMAHSANGQAKGFSVPR